ncbi:MAG: flagellar hook-length control protein FliK [Synergistaceae bacterium]|nr:flagellar hook-length control protein FliK [Synergistaceae bacterium]
MSNTQNAFLLPPPAPQQTHQAHQANPAYKPFNKKPDAAENETADNAFTSFVTLLNQAADRKDGESEPSPALDSAQEENRAGISIGEGDKQTFSQYILDLMASLRSDLEKKGADAGALSEEANDVLNEIGLGTFDWDSKTVEAVLARLRDRYATTPESDSPENTGVKAPADYPAFGLEAPLTDNADAEQLTGAPQMNGVQPRQGTVSKLYSHLADASKEAAAMADAAALDAKPADQQTGKNAFVDVEAALINNDAEPRDKPSADLRGRGEHGEKPKGGRHEEAAANIAPRETADTDKSADEPKPRANFTEHRTAFEQFFDNVMARRETADTTAAPGLELTRGSPFSQGEALRDGLYNVVRFISANGEQKANLIIDPPALGRVSVELVNGSTGLEASIKVGSEQVRQLIQDHLAQLRFSLEQQGVQLTNFSVDVQQNNEHSYQGQGNPNRRRAASAANEEDAVDEGTIFRVDLEQGLLYWIA